MTTPSKLTREEAKEQMRTYIREQTYREADQRLRHAACGAPIQFVPAYLSIHSSDISGCAGAGRVEIIPIPYCPACEPEPEAHGCIHIPGESIPLRLLDLTS